MRILKLILFCVSLCLLSSLGYGQANGKVNFGGTLPTQIAWAARFLQVDSAVKLLKYATSDTDLVLGFDINGNGVLRRKVPAGSGSGTVTNVSTGWGTLGGPITSAGTIRADSNYVLSVLRGYKIVDSVAAIANGKQAQITLTTSGTSGAATFLGNVLNVPIYEPDLSGYVPTSRTLTINGTALDLSVNRTWNVGTVTGITFQAPLTGGSISTSGTVSIPAASASDDGYLTAGDWAAFDSKQPSGNYITDLTGDVTATGPGSVAATIANGAVTNSKIANSTIDLTAKVAGVLPLSNGGTNATTTTSVNGTPITYGSNNVLPVGTGTVTSVNVATANGFAGTVLNPTTTPSITLTTTVNAPVVAGNGTALIAGTTTGTGNTVMLNAGPTATGTFTAANITASGTISFTGGTVTLGSSTGNSTVGLGTGATSGANTKTINIGGASGASATQNINVGSTATGAQNIVIGSTSGTTNTTLNATVAFTGTATAITQTAGDNSTKLSTTAYADAAANAKVASVSGVSGRISSTGGTTPVIDLVTVNASPATVGSSTVVPVVTVDAYGRVTATSSAPTLQTVNATTATTLNIAATTGVQQILVTVTAQSGNLVIANPTGTFTEGERVLFVMSATGSTTPLINWGNMFTAATSPSTFSLPSAFTASKTIQILFIYHNVGNGTTSLNKLVASSVTMTY